MHEPRRGDAEKPEFQDVWVTKAVDLAPQGPDGTPKPEGSFGFDIRRSEQI